MSGANAIEFAEQILLDLEILEHRFDHEIAGCKIINLRGVLHTRENGIPLIGGELSPLDGLGKKVCRLFRRPFQTLGTYIIAYGAEASARGDNGNSCPHRAAGAAHSYSPDRRHFAAKLRPISWRWIWLVPSQIWVILASRISRSTRKSRQ